MAVFWWAVAAFASNYIYNWLPHSAVGCSPFELWYGCKPNIANLWVWGCLPYVHLQKEHGTHTRLCTFVAYCDDYKCWEFLEHETCNRVISRDILWQENTFKNAPWIPWPEEPPVPQPPAPQEALAALQQPAGQSMLPCPDGDLDLRGGALPAPDGPLPDLP